MAKARASGTLGRSGFHFLLPTPIKLLGDRDDGVCLRATGVLLAFGPEAKAATAALTKLLFDSRRRAALRAEAALVLGYVSTGEALAVNALVQGLHDAAFDVRIHAICALARIGPAAAGSVPALRECLKDPALREAATETIGRITEPTAFPPLEMLNQ